MFFAIAICIPALAWRRGALGPIAAFWAAYVALTKRDIQGPESAHAHGAVGSSAPVLVE